MKQKGILILIAATVPVLILLKLLANKRTLDERNQLPAVADSIRIPVTATIVQEEAQAIQLIKTGVVAPYKHIQLLAPTSGQIDKLLFTPGQKVVKGQPLVVIYTRLLQADLAKAEWHTARLKKEVDTYTELYEGNAATAQKLSEVRALYEDAQREALRLRKQIADATITAPEAGVMGAKEAEEGEFVTAGNAIGTIINQLQLKVKVQVTQAQVYTIHTGQTIRLTTAAQPGKAIMGMVTFISPQANETYNYEVEITAGSHLLNSPLLPGTLVNADFSAPMPGKMLLVPREAFVEYAQQTAVYVARNGRAQLCLVKAGATVGSSLQVTEGLTPGSEVITSGQINLRNGAFIHITKPQP